MHPIIKYIAFPLLISTSINYSSYCQSNNSEVVLTKTELETLLTKIAKAKKEQLLKNQIRINRNNAIDDSLISLIQSSQEQNNNNQRVFDEINRLHLRIDQLVLLQGKNNGSQNVPTVSLAPIVKTQTIEQGSSNSQPTTKRTDKKPAEDHKQPTTVINNYYTTKENKEPKTQTTIIKQGNNTEAVQSLERKQDEEFNHLQSQIANLNEQIRVLTTLNKSQNSIENVNDIVVLESKIEELKSIINNSSKRVDTVVKIVEIQKETPIVTTIKEQVKAEPQAKQLAHTLYFANNSSIIEKKDYPELKEIANTVKGSRNTVVLRGFASNTGSALYNQKLSFNRANAIKKILLQNGLNANQIIILNHGIDSSTDAINARRVEISLIHY